jgi:hypothetical protein
MAIPYLIYYPGGTNLLEYFWALAEDLTHTNCRPVYLGNHQHPSRYTTWLLQTDIPHKEITAFLQAKTKGHFLLIPLEATDVFSQITSVHKAIYDLSTDDIIAATTTASESSIESPDSDAASKAFACSLASAKPLPIDEVLDKLQMVGMAHLNPLELGSLYLASGEREPESTP